MLTTRTSIAKALLQPLFIIVVAAPGYADNQDQRLTTDQAVERLTQGNSRFVSGKPEHPDIGETRMAETAKIGQRPFASIVSCSDSRVPVEVIFDQGIGNLFVIRVAGNVCNLDEIGSAEYGIDHLVTPLLVVLGHTQCGAVTAVATGAELHGNILPVADSIRPAVAAAQKTHPDQHGKDLVPAAIEANVWQAMDDLFKASPVTRTRAKTGKLKVIGAIYEIETGKVRWLGEHPQLNRLLAYTDRPLHAGKVTASAESQPSAPPAQARLTTTNQADKAPVPAMDKSTHAEKPPTTTAPAGHASPSPAAAQTADEVLGALTKGNARFTSGKPEHPNAGAPRVAETASNGQHPVATIVSCSDSRVPVELILDQGIGDLFIIRVAGNVCGVDEIGSAEYGTEHLGTPLLIVLGHTQCGAVHAVVTDADLRGNIPFLAEKIKPAAEAVKKTHPDLQGKAMMQAATDANVWQAIEDLFTRSPITRERVKSGKLKVIGAIYEIETGKVDWRGPHPEQNRFLAATEPAAH
jgi:carbonic anhydrase